MYEITKEDLIIICTAGETVSDFDTKEFLCLLDKLLDSKKKFSLLIDTSRCNMIPVKLGLGIIKWMRKRKPDIIEYLIGSSIVIKSKMIAGFISKIFSIQTPSRPNLITSDILKSKEFLKSLKETNKTI